LTTWTEGSSKLSTSTPEPRSVGWQTSSRHPSRPSPAATDGCSTVTPAGRRPARLPAARQSDWQSGSAARQGPHRSLPPSWHSGPTPPGSADLWGTEIFTTIRSRDRHERTPLLLGKLTVGRQIIAVEAYCLLHLFVTGSAPSLGASVLSCAETEQLRSPPATTRLSPDRSTAKIDEGDWPSFKPSPRTAALRTGRWQYGPTGTSRPFDVESRN